MNDSSVQVIYGDPHERYKATLMTNIVYARRETGDLRLQIICPDFRRTGRTYPLIVFVNAGGWRRPDTFAELPQLSEFAHNGYVVASIEHRGVDRDGNIEDGARFPDAIVDTKEAVRFLKAHAMDYGINPNYVALMGSATGAHTVLMAAFTDGNPQYDFGAFQEYSSTVQAVVEIHAETDFTTISEDRLAMPNYNPKDFLEDNYPIELQRLFGTDASAYDSQMVLSSPVTYISDEREIPPIMIIHDEGNHVVPIRQSERLFETLREHRKKTEMYKIVGASWLRGLWTPELVQTILHFLNANM